MGEWIKKTWYVHTVKHYLAFEKKNPIIWDIMDGPGRHYTK